MARIRSIEPGEVELFASAGDERHAADQLGYVSRLLNLGATRTDWCFVAEDMHRVVGRVGLWTLPGVNRPLSIILLDATDDTTALGLLAHAARVAREAGAELIDTVLDEPAQPPQWQADVERRARWLESAGFLLRRTTSRWEVLPGEARPHASGRLHFRGLPEVGRPAFLKALACVSAESLDQRTREDRERLGPAREVRQTWNLLRQMDSEPGWWELAFDETDAFVGLVMPTLAAGTGTIGYLGVDPSHRGRGYGSDLLARGTRALLTTAATIFRADTDIRNAPMAATLRRAGWRSVGTRREYECDLA